MPVDVKTQQHRRALQAYINEFLAISRSGRGIRGGQIKTGPRVVVKLGGDRPSERSD